MASVSRVTAVIALLLLAGCTSGVDTITTQESTPRTTLSPTVSPNQSTTPTAPQTITPTTTEPPPLSPTSAAPRGPQQGTQWTVTITRVIDGDTVEARFPNGATDTLRLLGVDTPETTLSGVHPEEFEGIPSTTAGRDHLLNWGAKAAAFTTNELEGKTVRIEVDPQADRRGGFGRLLVYIYVDGENFNERLLTEGYARVYDAPFSKRSQFERAAETAQANNVGLWGFAPGTPAFTRVPPGGQEGTLVVSRIHEDADGNDHENENDEYVIFENTGESTLDLSGWSVSDEADHTYYFPTGFTLEAGQQVTLYTGRGTDSDTELYWGSDSAIWNNGGDTILVSDRNGNVVLEESY